MADTDSHDPADRTDDPADDRAAFIDFMIGADVLRFGDFVTKSGRNTPYFINTGLYRTGEQIKRLGEYYAKAVLREIGTEFDVVFGPAYKGIPLAVSTAAALADLGHAVGYAFNRKEEKDHGEGGRMVGHPLADGDRVLIIEDITTAGTAIREVVPLLRAEADIELAGLVVSVDRCERGLDDRSALQALAEEFAMPTFAIITIHEILAAGSLTAEQIAATERYLEEYGVPAG